MRTTSVFSSFCVYVWLKTKQNSFVTDYLYCDTLSESLLLSSPTAEEAMSISMCSLLHLLRVCSILKSHLVLIVPLLHLL